MSSLAAAALCALLVALAQAAPQAPPATPTPTPAPSPSPPPRAPDIYFLRNGDRITGRTLIEGRRAFTVQTPFGRLTIPRSRLLRIRRADGAEVVLQPAESIPALNPMPARRAPRLAEPAPPQARLMLAITGKTFWQAWDPKEAGRDPALRLEVRLDEEPVVMYLDRQPDPDEIPGAVVNAFSFVDGLSVTPAPRVRVHPPDVRPGRIVLKLDLPAGTAGDRRLRLAYQLNTGTLQQPAWKDVVSASTELTLSPKRPALVEVRQDRGRMEFAGFPRRRMRHVETFQLDLSAADGLP